MAAQTARRGRVPPPRRGVTVHELGGEVWHLPRGGGGKKLGPAPAPGADAPEWSAKTALRESGVRAGRRAAEAGDAAARAAQRGASTVTAPAVDSASSVGTIAVYVFASIIGLAILRAALGGKGPAAVSKGLGWLTGSLEALLSPRNPLFAQGTVPAPAASTSSSSSSGAGTSEHGTGSSGWGAPLSSNPGQVAGVRFTGASLVGVRGGFVRAVAQAAAAAGATIVDVISGRRSEQSNAAAGGVSDSNHLTGDAIDARAFIPGKGWVPLGSLTSALSSAGLRSGDVAGFFNGHPDPNHVDTGANQ